MAMELRLLIKVIMEEFMWTTTSTKKTSHQLLSKRIKSSVCKERTGDKFKGINSLLIPLKKHLTSCIWILSAPSSCAPGRCWMEQQSPSLRGWFHCFGNPNRLAFYGHIPGIPPCPHNKLLGDGWGLFYQEANCGPERILQHLRLQPRG